MNMCHHEPSMGAARPSKWKRSVLYVPNGGARKARYMPESPGERWVVNVGSYSLDPHGTRGGLQSLMENFSSGETSVGMYNLKEDMEKFCSDLLASH
jgi:hypothetical protein